MNDKKELKLHTAILLLAIPLVFFAAYKVIPRDLCTLTIAQQLNNTDNSYTARVISRDCGALATGQTYVEVERKSLFASPQEVLEVIGPDHDKEITLSWVSLTKLKIYYDGYLSNIQSILYNTKDLTIETYAREKVLTENYIRKLGDEGGYLKLIDENGRLVPSVPISTPTPSRP